MVWSIFVPLDKINNEYTRIHSIERISYICSDIGTILFYRDNFKVKQSKVVVLK